VVPLAIFARVLDLIADFEARLEALRGLAERAVEPPSGAEGHDDSRAA
jgi:hypothetical protein